MALNYVTLDFIMIKMKIVTSSSSNRKMVWRLAIELQKGEALFIKANLLNHKNN
ncbi:12780_t:CDS:2 [Gigaspora margarita]|uniref:12780_t:CDS:1 n=1 Tax=Gigaspora margarita TaxID=4874 RepID=A0ABN7UNU9_GIGMA|nr:12780_t:CDS:2 [Gigaspora margarita]